MNNAPQHEVICKRGVEAQLSDIEFPGVVCFVIIECIDAIEIRRRHSLFCVFPYFSDINDPHFEYRLAFYAQGGVCGFHARYRGA